MQRIETRKDTITLEDDYRTMCLEPKQLNKSVSAGKSSKAVIKGGEVYSGK